MIVPLLRVLEKILQGKHLKDTDAVSDLIHEVTLIGGNSEGKRCPQNTKK